MCLYCNERCHAFNSLEAVRKHMVAKSHCKVHFGDGGDDEEAELEEFYDYSSRFYLTCHYMFQAFVLSFFVIKPLFYCKSVSYMFGLVHRLLVEPYELL